jgi:hypothetical protein
MKDSSYSKYFQLMDKILKLHKRSCYKIQKSIPKILKLNSMLKELTKVTLSRFCIVHHNKIDTKAMT